MALAEISEVRLLPKFSPFRISWVLMTGQVIFVEFVRSYGLFPVGPRGISETLCMKLSPAVEIDYFLNRS